MGRILLATLRLLGGQPGSLEMLLLRRLKAPPWEQTVANNITMLRTRIGFWGIHGFYWPYVLLPQLRSLAWVAFGSLVVAALLDWVDGPVARRRGEESGFGRFADPFSDKTIAWSAFCVLLHHYRFALWLLVPAASIALYDVTVSWARTRDSEMRTNIVAKLKQWPLDIGVVFLTFGILLDWNVVDDFLVSKVTREWITTLGSVSLWIAFGLACVSGCIYSWKHLARLYWSHVPTILRITVLF